VKAIKVVAGRHVLWGPKILWAENAEGIASLLLPEEFNQVTKVDEEAFEVAPAIPITRLSKTLCRKPEHINLIKNSFDISQLGRTRRIHTILWRSN
jgi:hypothetical protein